MIHEYMIPKKRQVHETENYVSSPPAAQITDAGNNVWSLGYRFAQPAGRPAGEFAFNVLRNGFDTGEYASRIERRFGKIRIFTATGWKIWSGRTFF